MTARGPNLTPVTGGGLTSLGAVGGARGTAAGGLRVLVEFLSTYDADAVKKLESDISDVQQKSAALNAEQTSQLSKQAELEARIAKAKELKGTLDRQDAQALAKINELETKIALAREQHRASSPLVAEQQRLIGLIHDADTGTRKQYEDLAHLTQLQAELNALKTEEVATTEAITAAQHEQVALQEQSLAIQNVKSSLPTKLGALALGALGATFGGAFLQVGFDAAQALIDKFTDTLKDILDPARHAREALKDVASQVTAIASQDNISNLEAASKLIDSLGEFNKIGGGTSALQPALLAQAAHIQDINTNLQKYKDLATVALHLDDLQAQAVNDLAKAYQDADKHRADLIQQQNVQGLIETSPAATAAQRQAALDEYNRLQIEIDATTAASYDFARGIAGSTDEVNRLAAAADLASIKANNLAQNIQDAGDAALQAAADAHEAAQNILEAMKQAEENAASGAAEAAINAVTTLAEVKVQAIRDQIANLHVIDSERTKSLEAQLNALSTAGPSQRTQQLSDAIDHLNASEDRLAYNLQLHNLALQKRDLILEHHLSLVTHIINWEKYSGQERSIALQAEIDRLGKVNEAQQALNDKLSLQYRMNQFIRRQVGESIQDYLARRAQENRDLLSQKISQDIQAKQKKLQDEKDLVDYRIALHKLEQQRDEVIRQHDEKLQMEHLQKELEASKKADSIALAEKRQTLEAELKISKQKDQDELESRRRALEAQITAIQDQKTKEIQIIRDATAAAKQEIDNRYSHELQVLNDTYDKETAAYKRRLADELDLANQAEVNKRKLALGAANTYGDIELAAGLVGGSALAYGELQAQIKALGLSGPDTDLLLANASSLRSEYLAKLRSLDPGNTPTGHYAKGGVFELNNSMNFGSNIRVGEEGSELGVILSNKVYQAIKDNQDHGPLIGSLTFQSSGDPKRDRYKMRQEVRSLAREELNR